MSLNEANKEQLIVDLLDFHKKLSNYKQLAITIASDQSKKRQLVEFDSLRGELQKEFGYIDPFLENSPDLRYITIKGSSHDVFNVALVYPSITRPMLSALECALMIVNINIGNLRTGPLLKSSLKSAEFIPPKAFIAHGGESKALDKLQGFLRALGVKPIVVEVEASEGRWTEQQVEEYMGAVDCAIILATFGNIVDIKKGVKHPRLNVIDELARSRNGFLRKRTILLLEKNVQLPTNVSGIARESFTKQCMDKAFIKVANELSHYGLLRAIKTE